MEKAAHNSLAKNRNVCSLLVEKLDTNQERLFCLHYVHSMNELVSAREAGYEGSDEDLEVIAQAALTSPPIRRVINEIFTTNLMSREEALGHLAKMAFADVSKMFVYEGDRVRVDLKKAQEHGLTFMIKELEITTQTTTKKDGNVEKDQLVDVELHDQEEALKILKEAVNAG